jgi:hypothetical protein
MPATRRKLNTIHRLLAAASPATETSSSDIPATATGTTDVAPVTNVDAADNVSKADNAAAGKGAVEDGKEE